MNPALTDLAIQSQQQAPAVPGAPVPVDQQYLNRYISESGQSVSSGDLDPEQRTALEDAQAITAQRQLAATEMGRIEAQRADIAAEEAAEQAKLDAQFAEQQKAALEQQQAAVDEANKQTEAEYQKYRSMPLEGYWTNKSTGNKIIAAIAVGLGAYSSAINGGQNQALAIINGAIEQDFAAKKQRLERAASFVERAGKNSEQVRKQMDAMLESLNLQKAAAKAQVAAQFKAKAALLGSSEAESKAHQAALVLEAEANKDKQKVLEVKARKVTRSSSSGEVRADARLSGGGTASVPKDANVYGPGGVAIADVKDPAKATKINAANENFRKMDALLGDLEKNFEQGWALPYTDLAQDRESKLSQLSLAIKDQANLGALSGSDMDLMTAQTSTGAEKFTGSGINKLRTLRKDLARKHAVFLDSQGMSGDQTIRKLKTPAPKRQESAPAPTEPPPFQQQPQSAPTPQSQPKSAPTPKQASPMKPPVAGAVLIRNKRTGEMAWRLPDGSIRRN